MNRNLIFILLVMACGTVSENSFKVASSFDSFDNNAWTMPSKPSMPVVFEYDGGDTAYFVSNKGAVKENVTKYIRQNNNLFTSEPNDIKGHKFAGVFVEPNGLPGIYVLIYVKKNTGFLMKFCPRPGRLNFCSYYSTSYSNPLRDLHFQQVSGDKITFTDTIRINKKGFDSLLLTDSL